MTNTARLTDADGTGRNVSRQRFLNAVVYFATNTNYCGKIKLFKLLYLLDFQHFRETGRSVTGFDYWAWELGPVPVVLMDEWENPKPDFNQVVEIVPEQVITYRRETVRPKVEFDADEFTPRQIRIMESLATEYKETKSPKMIDVVHAENGAWAKVWKGGSGARNPIPYELSLDDAAPNKEAALERQKEDRQRLAALRSVG